MASNSGSNGAAARKIHPGAGRRQAPAYPKGRQIDAGSQEDLRGLLGEGPYERDLLIEYLHRIQDSRGHLSAGHLQALAEAMKLPMAEVFEVASFYAHFDIVLDGEAPPAPLTIRVCDSLTCEMMGAQALLAKLPDRLGSGVRVVRAPCMGRCDCAPVAEVGHRHVDHATLDKLAQTAESGDHHPVLPNYTGYEAYVADGGYQTLRACYEGRHEADDLVAKLEDSQLKGKGGAGFPAGLKWKILRQQTKPRLFAINADEGEPGTFKDRFYLESDPHRFLEGMLIAAWATEVETCYIYLRDEYPAVRAILLKEIARIEAEGLTGGCRVELRRGAGAYICGEESAMIESIEGKRGLPRHKPPYPSEAGLFGLPTLTHNVETVFWLRDIIEKGPAWYADQGRRGRKGFHSFSVSGRVKKPGVKVAPAGVTIRELIDEYSGGMAEGHSFAGYLPGGASGGILPARLDDLPIDFGTLQEHGCFIGSAAVVVLSDKDDIKKVALNLMRFFEDESCGQCTPCRNGTEKAVQMMSRETWDAPLLEELSQTMMDASICGLGQAAPNPLLCVLKYFPEALK
ncbi:MAG: NAD(P)H-dependent oxidoreductase subunit E [Kiloniellales bacterium]|nr:NAD(P)H-dependent oxidoreductase subunit E [Kiloniellales bacterium]